MSGVRPAEDSEIRLPDGRRLGYAIYGDPDGVPVVYCHGFPGSRLEAAPAHLAARRLGIRLIAPDRPGFGMSSFHPQRTLTDWADDVAALVDALGLGRFALLGVSGGAPYALACACRLGRRVTAIGIVAGLGPPELLETVPPRAGLTRTALRLARRRVALARWLWAGIALGVRLAAEGMLRGLVAGLPAADRAALADPAIVAALARSFRESVRQGTRGGALELRLYGRPWPMTLETLAVPVLCWHGGADEIVPAEAMDCLGKRIPGARTRLLPDDGHYSLPLRHMEEILAAVAGADPGHAAPGSTS